MSPEETVTKLLPMIPAMGITRVADVTGLDHIGIPVVMVCRPNSRSIAVAQGKGADLDAAKASGLMESIEQYHAERIDHPLRFVDQKELAEGHEVVDTEGLARLGVSTFHDRKRILWIASRDLVSGAEVYVPYESVHLDLTLPLPSGSGCFALGSNGLASGNHHYEAFVHGICELVERDAAALWRNASPAQRSATELDLETIEETTCRGLLERYEEASIEVRVWDLTSDIGIPVFATQIVDRSPTSWRLKAASRGYGCHPSRDIALSRSLVEAAQSRLTVIAGSRDDIGEAPDTEASDSLAAEEEERPKSTGRSLADAPGFEGENLARDVEWVLDRLVEHGFNQVLCVDLTRPEFGIPVVRIVIPGLEGPSEMPGLLPGPRLRARLAAVAPAGGDP